MIRVKNGEHETIGDVHFLLHDPRAGHATKSVRPQLFHAGRPGNK